MLSKYAKSLLTTSSAVFLRVLLLKFYIVAANLHCCYFILVSHSLVH